MENHPHKIYMGLLGAFLSLFVFWILGGILSLFGGNDASLKRETAVASEVKENPFNSVLLAAKSAIVYDALSKEILYDKKSETQLPLASLTKIMTALLAEETLSENGIVEVRKEAIREEGDSGLLTGERWSVRNLINLTLVSSSNDGAYALATAVLGATPHEEEELAFPDLMNRKAAELSLRQTFFINSSGLDVHEVVSGGYGSAKDFSLLLAYVLENYPHILEATSHALYKTISLDGKNHSVLNTHEGVESIPGIRASKTGFTDLAGGNLAVIFEIAPLHPVIAVVLGSTEEERFHDIKTLVDATNHYFGAYKK